LRVLLHRARLRFADHDLLQLAQSQTAETQKIAPESVTPKRKNLRLRLRGGMICELPL
jgi:hypothetical protein